MIDVYDFGLQAIRFRLQALGKRLQAVRFWLQAFGRGYWNRLQAVRYRLLEEAAGLKRIAKSGQPAADSEQRH